MKGAIIIHGLTGTPAAMAPLTEALAHKDFLVETPLLAGHGTTLNDLSKTRWKEWFKCVSDAYYNLIKRGVDKIYCAGLSLGSLLTLKLALEEPLIKIACLGTPLRLAPILEKLVLPLSHLPPMRNIVKMTKKSWEASVADEIGREIYKGASYSKIPVRSVWELQRLQREVLKYLACLKTPTLLIHSKNDKVAPPFNVDLFCKKVRYIKPEIVWLKNSEHVATLDFDKEFVVEKVAEFFRLPVL